MYFCVYIFESVVIFVYFFDIKKMILLFIISCNSLYFDFYFDDFT